MGFYFDRISLFNGGRVESVTGATGDPRRAPGPAGRAEVFIDPVTGESSKEDWRFEIYVDVVFQDFPEPADESAAEEAAEPQPEEP